MWLAYIHVSEIVAIEVTMKKNIYSFECLHRHDGEAYKWLSVGYARFGWFIWLKI